MNESWEVYAKILSQEGVTIEYSDYAKTAMYNVETNVVVIPTFDFLTDKATQLMVSHEIAHAMFSKYSLKELSEYSDKYSDIFGVVEDAYIERSIKLRYPGLSSIFTEGYSDLAKAKFFEYSEGYNLIDRLNIYSKMPHIWDIPFTGPEENEFAVRITKLNSSSDVIALCQDILDYLNDNDSKNNEGSDGSEETDNGESDKSNDSSGSSDNSDGVDESCQSDISEDEEQSESSEDDDSSPKSQNHRKAQGKNKSETVSETQRNFQERTNEYGSEQIKNACSNSNRTLALSTDLIFERYYNNFSKLMKKLPSVKLENSEIIIKTVKDVAKHADMIFKQRKSAWENKESRKKPLGNIDTKRLSKYKTSMDIFRTKITIPDGKNHGIVILIDYSGSMSASGVLPMVICQAAVVGEFCRMNDIPFEIIAFGIAEHNRHLPTSKNGVAKLCDSLTFSVEAFVRYSREIHIGNQYICCHNTPTIEGLIVAERTIRKFKESGIEKTSLFIITDGVHNSEIQDADGSDRLISDVTKIVIDNVMYDVSKECKKPLSHLDWSVELTCGWIKKLHGTYISLTFLESIDTVKNMTWDKMLEYAGFETVGNTSRTWSDDFYYIFKLFYYFEDKKAKIIDTSQNGLMTCNFTKNPYMDQVQILDIMESTSSTQYMPWFGGLRFNFEPFDMLKKIKTMKIFVQKFIEKIS